MTLRLVVCAAMALAYSSSMAAAEHRAPGNTYRGELVAFPGPWQFQIPGSLVLFVRDDELEAMAVDPDKVMDLAVDGNAHSDSLRKICERAKAQGARTLTICFDQFYAQYRKGQATPRRFMPDTDEYIERIAKMGRFAKGYGLGLELSLLSPLEIGRAYTAKTGESGLWMHYREGWRDPHTGAFSVELWRQKMWANNKGNFAIADAGVRVFAFDEERLREAPYGDSQYSAVDPARIVEVTAGVEVEKLESDGGRLERIRVYAKGATVGAGLRRVLVVQQYKTPEMDYFSPNALPFLKGLIDRYAAAGITLNGLYSDEMHIQQDWVYNRHQDHGEFALRYVSPGLAREYAKLYGPEYADFARFLVYFAHGQHDWDSGLDAKRGEMHSFGKSAEEVQKTALFRSRYYRLLQDRVVDLFTGAKRYAEDKMGHRLMARAHATWAQSPTIDFWDRGLRGRAEYEYTSKFIWSNTVQQASAACHDYFKWGDFLTGNGNDHAEGGWIDQDYYGLALGCSTGILNEVPNSYAAHWGVPDAIGARRSALEDVYGTAPSPAFAMVEDYAHRDVQVLMLYPLDLVAAEERFGSWMTQYGYANYITPAKLLERGSVVNGALEVAGRRFTTLVTLFEPFPSAKLLSMMREFVEGGGRLVWSGPPPVWTAEGEPALDAWQSLFGAEYKPSRHDGTPAPGMEVHFGGALAAVAPQMILTDFLVDRVYAVTPGQGTETVARVKEWTVGTERKTAAGGRAVFLGFRPRDDQSRSLGYDARGWFDVLTALGAYPATGRFTGFNDNSEYVSRTGDVLACRFPNGAVAIAPHLRGIEEGWDGGYSRKQDVDAAYMEQHPAPSEALHLSAYRVQGHTVSYEGKRSMAFRVNEKKLEAFAGLGCAGIAVDGTAWRFAERPLVSLAWAPVAPERRVAGGAVLEIIAAGEGTVRIPDTALPGKFELIAEGAAPGSRGAKIASRAEKGALVFALDQTISGKRLFVVPVN